MEETKERQLGQHDIYLWQDDKGGLIASLKIIDGNKKEQIEMTFATDIYSAKKESFEELLDRNGHQYPLADDCPQGVFPQKMVKLSLLLPSTVTIGILPKWT